MSYATSMLLLPLLAVIVLAFSFAIRRLAGDRPGALRTVAAAGGAVLLIGPIEAFIGLPDGRVVGPLLPSWSLLIAAGVAVVTAATGLIVLEAAKPTRRDRSIKERLTSLRSIRLRWGRVAALARLIHHHRLVWRILGALRRGDDEQSLKKLGAALRQAFEDAGVTFVKFGQLLSTRPDLVTATVARELRQLTDQAAPLPWSAIRARVEEGIGTPMTSVFASVEETPLAAASIAQVHAAVLTDGRPVVIKVQRPDARSHVEGDLEVLAAVARWFERATRWGRSIGLGELVNGFSGSLRSELDFTVEMRNMRRIRRDLAGISGVVVPDAAEALTAPTVLVMERLYGSSPRRDDARTSRTVVARCLVRAFLHQVLVSGVFHTDPHHGNVLLLTDGRVGLLDFGSVGHLDRHARVAAQRLVYAVGREHGPEAAREMAQLVDLPPDVDMRAFRRAVTDVVTSQHALQGSGMIGRFDDLAALAVKFRFRIPPMTAALFRCLSTLEVVLNDLDPAFDLVREAHVASLRLLVMQVRDVSPTNPILHEALSWMARAPMFTSELTDEKRSPPHQDARARQALWERGTRTAIGFVFAALSMLALSLPNIGSSEGRAQVQTMVGYTLSVLAALSLLSAWQLGPRRGD